MKKTPALGAALGLMLSCIVASGQLRLEEHNDYPNGEVNAASGSLWSIRNMPYAEIVDGAVVVDHNKGLTFNGAYQRRYGSPSSKEMVYTSFKLKVTAPPQEAVGFSFAGVADIDFPDLYRARVFMKKGNAPDTFRLGLSISASAPVATTGEKNAVFFKADLQLNEEYLVLTSWDNVNLVARLYIDTNDQTAHRVELTGGTPRANGFRRFGILMNSGNHLGRYQVDDIFVAEDWNSIQQTYTQKPAFVIDPVPLPDAPGYYDDPVFHWHYYYGGGWSQWLADNARPNWGFLYIAARNEDGDGWIYHLNRGWVYLFPGSVSGGVFGYSYDFGWFYAWEGFGEDWFYVYSPSGYLRWNP